MGGGAYCGEPKGFVDTFPYVNFYFDILEGLLKPHAAMDKQLCPVIEQVIVWQLSKKNIANIFFGPTIFVGTFFVIF